MQAETERLSNATLEQRQVLESDLQEARRSATEANQQIRALQDDLQQSRELAEREKVPPPPMMHQIPIGIVGVSCT